MNTVVTSKFLYTLKQKESFVIEPFKFFRARGVYYVTTNAKPPYARGLPAKHRQTTQARSTTGPEYDNVRKK